MAGALHSSGHPLFYWESTSIAEVDFLLTLENEVIPAEVKAGTRVNSRSLSVFLQKYHAPYSLRISQKNFGFENRIKSIPLYAVYCLSITCPKGNDK